VIGQVLAICGRILSTVGTILGITQTIQALMGTPAQSQQLTDVQDSVNATLGIVGDATFGNSAILDSLVLIAAQIDAQTATLLTAIGTPQQAGSPVTLPTIPPAGYGGGSSTLTAADVWDFPDGDGSAMGDNLRSADRILQNWAEAVALVEVGQPYLKVVDILGWDRAGGNAYFPQPPLDAATIIHADHNFSDWVTRAYPSYGWLDFTIDNSVVKAYQDTGVDHVYWCQAITQFEFELLKAQQDGVFIPVIWPGEAFVTFGSTTAIDTLVVIAENCEGIIVNITGVPPGQSFFAFGDQPSYRYIGAIAFGSIEGFMEQSQNLGFTSAVYVPKTMAIAGVIQVRAAPGVTGTITTWSFS
jgi:hypothetical protein